MEGEDSEKGSVQQRKLFLGGLNYNTTEDDLVKHFEKYGVIVDVVVMKFPDTQRSRGFGFVTFSHVSETDDCFNERPHVIDGSTVDVKRSTPKREMKGAKREEEGEPESHRKLFIGGLSQDTQDDDLRAYFSQFGELVDCVVMRFQCTRRSRGFGFVTYSSMEEVDKCQQNRPHKLDGRTLETKRATKRSEGKKESGHLVTRIFVGGLKDEVEDKDLEEYFSNYGEVVSVDQLMNRSTGRKRGFGFVKFADYDAVDRVVLEPYHTINSCRIEVKKAVPKESSSNDGGGRNFGFGSNRSPNDRCAPAPWGDGGGFFGGNSGGFNDAVNFGGGFCNSGSFGMNNFQRSGGGRFLDATDQPNPWSIGGGAGFSDGGNGRSGGIKSWEDQGSSTWQFGSRGSFGDGYGSGNGSGGTGFGSYPGGGGGPIRNPMVSNRSAPYSMSGRGGGSMRDGGGAGMGYESTRSRGGW